MLFGISFKCCKAWLYRYKSKLAWEVSQFKSETKYLYNFLRGLKYIGIRIPEEGQSERLMLKYYNYLWEIRKFLKMNFGIEVLDNLSKFPLDMDTLDEEYYELVASNIASADLTPKIVRVSRYYIQKQFHFLLMEKDILRLRFNLQDYMQQNTIG